MGTTNSYHSINNSLKTTEKHVELPKDAKEDIVQFTSRHVGYALPFVYVTSRKDIKEYHYTMGCCSASMAITLDYAAFQSRKPCHKCYIQL